MPGPPSPSSSPSVAPKPGVSLAQARRLTQSWLSRYNAAYSAINATESQATIHTVADGSGAATQEMLLAATHYQLKTPGNDQGLIAIRFASTPEYWVPKSLPAGYARPWFVVKVTESGRSQPSYLLFTVTGGKAYLLEDPPAHAGVRQPTPVFDSNGYVQAAPISTGQVLANKYTEFWNGDTHAEANAADPRMASDNWSMRVFAQVNKGIRGHTVSHEQPYGVLTHDGSAFYLLGLYNDPSQLTTVMSIGALMPSSGTGFEEPAGILIG